MSGTPTRPGNRCDALVQSIEATPPFNGKNLDDRMLQCPAPGHPDLDPSCHYTKASDGVVLLCCQSWGCSFEDMLDGLGGFVPADAFPPGHERKNGYRPSTPKPRVTKPPPMPEPHDWVKTAEWRNRLTASIDRPGPLHVRYEARDEHDQPVLDPRKGKPRKRVKWPVGLEVSDLALYLSWDLDPTMPTIIVEGEKAADALRALGYQAVAIFGTTHTPTDEALALLGIGPFILWPDNDTDGRKVMSDLAGRLRGPVTLVGVPQSKPAGWDAADAEPDAVASLIAGAQPVENVVTGRTLADISDAPLEPLLLGVIETSGGTIMSAKGGTGKGATGVFLSASGVGTGMTPLVIDFENRPGEWARRLSGLMVPKDKVAYVGRSDLPPTHRSLPFMDLVDDLRQVIRYRGADFAIIDSISAATNAGDDKMKSDPRLPWEYMAAIEALGIPVVSFAHPPRGRTDGDPYGSVMWVNAARLVWTGSKAEGEGHRVRWRVLKNNERGHVPGFILSFAYGDDRRMESATWEDDEVATRDRIRLLLYENGAMEVAELADAWHEDDLDVPSMDEVERTKATLRQNLNRMLKDGLVTRTGPRTGKGGKWANAVPLKEQP